jgi:N-acetylglutamate synthase-like GNAT family acetyltransferase
VSSSSTIRRARPSDAAVIASLIQQHVASGTLLPRAPEFIAERTIDFLVATVGGRVVGCVHLDEYSPSLAEVRSIVVDAPFQGGGIGGALVTAVERLAAAREYRTLFAVSNNDAFFRSRGYAPREIPELSRERSEVTRFKGVYAKDLGVGVRPDGATF